VIFQFAFGRFYYDSVKIKCIKKKDRRKSGLDLMNLETTEEGLTKKEILRSSIV